ncbi:hypothetical protein KVG29_08620 [Caldicoprobacter algeriensis]|nr:hypothetical protein [Caldicoprobacter algeriensis]MCM8901284.1 hypothetical protein [Caldicoprobacter algeriensis]
MLEGSDITVEQLNDDAFARALDKLHTVNMKELVSRICLNMLKAHNLTIESLHLDTTSISVEGLYEGDEEDDFIICYGYSKDNRPDLKQFKIGAAVQQSGLPVMGQFLSGRELSRILCLIKVTQLENLLYFINVSIYHWYRFFPFYSP